MRKGLEIKSREVVTLKHTPIFFLEKKKKDYNKFIAIESQMQKQQRLWYE